MTSSAICTSSQNVFNGLGLAADSSTPLQGRWRQGRGWNQTLGINLSLEGEKAAQKLFLQGKKSTNVQFAFVCRFNLLR